MFRMSQERVRSVKRILALVAMFLTLFGFSSMASASGSARQWFYEIGSNFPFKEVVPSQEIETVSIPLTTANQSWVTIPFSSYTGGAILVGQPSSFGGKNGMQIVHSSTTTTYVSIHLQMGQYVPFTVIGPSTSSQKEYIGFIVGVPQGSVMTNNNELIYWGNSVNLFRPGSQVLFLTRDAVGYATQGWVTISINGGATVSRIPANDGWMEFQVPNLPGATLTVQSGNRTINGVIIPVSS